MHILALDGILCISQFTLHELCCAFTIDMALSTKLAAFVVMFLCCIEACSYNSDCSDEITSDVVMAIASANTLNVIHSCRYWVLPFLLWVLLLFASSVAAVVILSVQASDNTDHIPCALISSKVDRCISSSPRILLQQTWLKLPPICSTHSLFGSIMDTRCISLFMGTLTLTR